MKELKMTEVICLNLFHSISLNSAIPYPDLFLPNNFWIIFNFELLSLIGYLSIFTHLFQMQPFSGGREMVHWEQMG